ncbi:hypothetical protein PHYSODRAFT_308292 [Phytophthora sojae]|uniref:Uncharacterized protein n=1 Tax=Phytophthora sojae (strain P6497) TaxID=1094619 RepID=G5AJJ5_PHYSP|nr:hypothetical protein PHYSODRAFT_308292 [Phytophthora sojae]EGZ04305.1 hypothetical protein PHYSODRAFT_308292 [Phytophthora sojae]|eukprot:XP_009540246.1 hypothetical protein PHYSODRAFT_308292 [Phytophthora sojae]
MEIVATDSMDDEVSCVGCVAILDQYRPRYGSAGSCPDTSSAPKKVSKPMTKDELDNCKKIEAGYMKHTENANVVNNPSSGELCYKTTDRFSMVKLFRESEKSCASLTSTCFDDATFGLNLANLRTNPFTTDTLQSSSADLDAVLSQQCTWCCRKTRKLKEQFKAYTCPTYYSSNPAQPITCEGDDTVRNTCSMNVCLEAKGTHIVTASVVVKSTVQTASTNVLNALPKKPDGSDVTKHVYYSIPCTSFSATDTNCRYTAKLSQLLDVRRAFTTTLPTPPTTLDVKDFVFWRYNVNGKSFVRWDPLADTAITFTDPTTTIVLEAWTACGMAYTTTFTVNLYLHSTLACSKFPAMWKVVEKPGVQGSEGTYCAYGGSDFAVLKLDMVVADVLQQSDTTVTGSYTGVTCSMMVKPTGGTDTSVVKVLEDSSAATISKYYGVELVNNPSTAQKTTGVVRCTFTRTPRTNLLALASEAVGTDANSIECSHTFTITDCDKPELNLGSDVCADKCAGDSAPGVLEACGGSIVTATATKTLLKLATTPTCCTKCSQALTCNTVGSSDVKRCEPPPGSLLLAEMDDADDYQSVAFGALPVLIVACALVAAVALVVAKRRADAAAESQDVYYPLME